MADAAPGRPYPCRVNPIRTCIACRARADQSELLRLVRVGDEVVDGTAPRLPGRGAYLHRGCIELAQQRHAVRRAFGPGATLQLGSAPEAQPR